MYKEKFDETYEQQSEVQVSLIEGRYLHALEVVRADLPETQSYPKIRWLDVGSNIGLGISTIQHDVPNIISADVQFKYLSSPTHPKTPKICLDASILPISNESCDVITSFETIEHIPLAAVHKFLDEAKRCLKSNGLLLISTPNRIANGNVKMSPDHHQEFSPEELSELLVQGGFEILSRYGQNFMQTDNIFHMAFKRLRESNQIRSLYERLPIGFVHTVRNQTLNAFGKGVVRDINNNEIPRVLYYVCRKA